MSRERILIPEVDSKLDNPQDREQGVGEDPWEAAVVVGEVEAASRGDEKLPPLNQKSELRSA